jgi:hypothetical protein
MGVVRVHRVYYVSLLQIKTSPFLGGNLINPLNVAPEIYFSESRFLSILTWLAFTNLSPPAVPVKSNRYHGRQRKLNTKSRMWDHVISSADPGRSPGTTHKALGAVQGACGPGGNAKDVPR